MPRFGAEVAEKREELEALLDRGFPIIPIQPQGKAALIPYRRFEEGDPPTLREWEKWLKKWPDCGIALVTGGPFAALDVDRKDTSDIPSPWLQGAIIRTPRPGWKTIFQTERPVESGTLALPMGPVEVVGRGKYAILPHSKHPNGGVYEWVTSWEDMAPFPAELEGAVGATQGERSHKLGGLISWVATRIKADCVRQLLSHELKAGKERNEGMFTLAALLRRAKVNMETATKWLLAYYRDVITDKAGMDEREVVGIVNSAYTSQAGYKIGCAGVRRRHGWIECGRCPLWNRRIEESMEKGSFLWRAYEAFKGDAVVQALAPRLLLLDQWELFTMSYSELSEITGINRKAISAAIKKMVAGGLLRMEDESQGLPLY